MRRRTVVIVGGVLVTVIVLSVTLLAVLGGNRFINLERHHPTPYLGPAFGIARYEYIEPPPKLLIFSPAEAPKVLAEMRLELGKNRGYTMTDQVKMEGLGDDDRPDFHAEIWGFKKGKEYAEYLGADIPLFSMGFLGVPAPKELQRGGCVVMISHTPSGIEAAWAKVQGWLRLR